jgi:Tol biopolymer transport system component
LEDLMTRCSVPVGGALLLAVVVLVAFPFEHRAGSAAPKFGDWSAPVNLGAAINTEFTEIAPHASKDGLSLYFASNRPASYGSFGGEDIWISQRSSTDAAWGLPMNLGQVINTASTDRSPALSRDGHYLFFASDRPGGVGGLDLWVSWRPNSHDDFGWEAPVNLGAAINTTGTDAGPSFFENDDAGVPHLYIASNRPGGLGALDIYVSELAGGVFQAPMLVQGINTASNDLTPSTRFDGLEIIFASNRSGSAGGLDLWAAVRDTVAGPWSAPVNLSTVNSVSSESFPSIAADRRSLFFDSARAGGFGGSDLYVSTR